jgi:hypothetical protein
MILVEDFAFVAEPIAVAERAVVLFLAVLRRAIVVEH